MNPPVNNNSVVQPSQNQRRSNGWNNPNQVAQPTNPPINNNPNGQNTNQQNDIRNVPIQQPQRPANVQWNIQKQQTPQQSPVQPQPTVNNPNPRINIISRPPATIQQNSPNNQQNNQPTATPVRAIMKPNPKPASTPPPKPVDVNKKPQEN